MASVSDSSLEAGLLALRSRDFSAAIAHLEAVSQTQLNQTAQVRAQMGLVVAFGTTGEISRAIALCQTLSKSTNPQVREWAVRSQAELTNRYTASSKSPETDLTGFVAFDSPPKIGSREQGGGSRGSTGAGGAQQNRSRGSTGAGGAGGAQQNRSRGSTGEGIAGESIHINNLSEQSSPTSPAPSSSIEWRQAGRARRWQPLPAVNLIPFWLLQVGTTIALFWLIRELLKFAMAFTNDLLVKLPYLEPFQPFYRDPTQSLLIALGILVCLSPWLLDGLLRLFYGLQPLSINTLSTHSPEAIRVLQRYCRQRSWPLPKLGILPTLAPVALTYGNLPRTARIVVSQGLLEQLKEDEIATIYAGQLGHIAHWDFVVMSLVMVVTQLPYTVYRQISQWGERIPNQILRLTAAAIASFAYGIWCLLGGPALWLSQLRVYYSDRLAAEITGNPNGLTRALLKIAVGIAQDIQQQGHTSWLLESLNLLTSLGYRQAITLGSLDPHTPFTRILAWDCLNPYRYWLIINNTHPLMGDRLQRLTRIAYDWHLETELNLVKQESRGRRGAVRERGEEEPGKSVNTASLQLSPASFMRRSSRERSEQSPPASPASPAPPTPLALLLQGAPFFGILLGFALGVLTWLIGGIGILLQISQLAWMYGDWLLIKGCLPIGFSIGTLMRINSFFPDIKPFTVQTDPSLPNLLANPTALPIDSQPVRLQGKLLGRRGISNWLGQDLILHSSTGLVKLHHESLLGPVGNLLPKQSLRPTDLVGQHLIATGWFRRGATPWIDIDSLRVQGGKTSSSSHPVWSTVLASAAAAWGAYVILWGGA